MPLWVVVFVDLNTLKTLDAKRKPANADDDWTLASKYYADQSRQDTKDRLLTLGVGIRGNAQPIEINLMRRLVDRLAAIYSSAPTRWLVDSEGDRLAENDARIMAMQRALRRSQYDLGWRKIDRIRTLLRQCAIRFYPSDARGAVVLRVFEPQDVLRDPSTEDYSLEADNRFALRIRGSGDDALWEYWARDGYNWTCAIVDNRGMMEPEQIYQPFGTQLRYRLGDLVCPYDQLPVQIIYDDYADTWWLPPRTSRNAFADAINAIANDLWELIVTQAHTDRFFIGDDIKSTDIPAERGPALAAVLPGNTQVQDAQPNPKILECVQTLETLIKLWCVSEDLPVDEFLQRTISTGVALKVAERALIARREAQILLAYEDERIAYRKYCSVHNYHAAAWHADLLDTSLDVEVQIADLAEPADERESQEAIARSLALGTRSIIDAIQIEHSVARENAIRIYRQVQQDQDQYPGPGKIIEPSGPKLAQATDLASLSGSASVMDVAQSKQGES